MLEEEGGVGIEFILQLFPDYGLILALLASVLKSQASLDAFPAFQLKVHFTFSPDYLSICLPSLCRERQ